MCSSINIGGNTFPTVYLMQIEKVHYFAYYYFQLKLSYYINYIYFT